MIASERRIVSEGETRHSLTKKLALSGRPVKIYVIDPKQFQARLQNYTDPKKTDVKSSVKKAQKSEEPPHLQKYAATNDSKNYSTCREFEDQMKMSRPVLIAPKESPRISSNGGTTIYFPPTTTLLPLQTMMPVSLSLPIMSVGAPGLGASVGNVISIPSGMVTASLPQEVPKNVNIKKKVLKKSKRPAKRTLTGEISKRTSISEGKEEEAEMAFLMKEPTTRTGRVSKSATLASVAVSTAPTTKAVVGPPLTLDGGAGCLTGPGVNATQGTSNAKKRSPPEKFRCQTCLKFYVGNAKFNEHFAKFSDHVKPNPNIKTKTSRKKNSSKTLSPRSSKQSIPHTEPTTTNDIDDDVIFCEPEPSSQIMNKNDSKCTNLQSQSSSTSPNMPNKDMPFTSAAMDEDDSFGIATLSPIMRRSTACFVNADTLSDNCTSPKNLPVFSMASSSTIFHQRRDNNDQSNNLVQEPQQQREYFKEFQTDFTNPSTSMALSQVPGNGSRQSFNALGSILSSNHSHLGPPLQTSTIRCNGSPQSSGVNSTTDISTFFSAASTSLNTSSQLRNHLHNSSVNVSSYISVNSCRQPVPSVSSSPFRLEGVDEESRDTALSPPNHGQPKRRSIWEFVKEQIRLRGINQTCGEISEMADKLSKIARDKFYPIQEDEVERLGTASPIIQVDTPFISHLLDLPLGTYVFKEDGGIRKIVPPPTPVSTELSLTNGVEVDVDKFLSPDIDLISLPHLTNLDFNSICN